VEKGEKKASVIAPHGHGSAGKVSVAGLSELLGIDGSIKKYNYDYGVQLVKTGFIVFCPDARGFGERSETHLQGDDPVNYLDYECNACSVVNRMAIALGQSIVGMWVWDLMRLIDYIETREDCDAGRIGCAGLSGGGMQTLWLTALDDRIRACVVSGYYYGFKEALLELNNCSCNYAPHIWEYIDAGDLGALIAPRYFIIETGTEDGLNGKSKLENVIPQVDMARKAYGLFGAEGKVIHDIFEGGHKWHGTVAIPKLQEVL
jgi:Dienelactone hydrolase and related enzymes